MDKVAYQKVFQDAVKKSIESPEWFYRNILKIEPLDWQVNATNAVFDVRKPKSKRVFNKKGLPRISVRSCHGTGKTQFLAMLMHIWNFTTYGKIACTAPKEAQLRNRLWPRYRKAYSKSDASYKKTIQVLGREILIRKDPDWGAVAETASDPDNLAGYHDTPQLFLIDEASAKRLDPMFPVIEGALTTTGSVSVEIGNPTRSEGEFWSHHNKKGVSDLYFKMHVKPEDAPGFISQSWVDTMIIKYGRDSPVVKIRVFGEFAGTEPDQLIPYGLVADASNKEFEEDGSVPRLVVSLDVAAGGEDFTVVEASRFYQSFTYKIRQEKKNYDAIEASIKAATHAAEMFERFGGNKDVPCNDMIVVDMMGVGNGAYNFLVMWGYPVVGYSGGSSSDDKHRWRNRRVQSYWAMHDDLAAGRVVYAENFVDSEEDWDEYCDQVVAVRRRIGEERVEDLEPKEVLIKRTGKSPDRADASAMAYCTVLPDTATLSQHTQAVAYSNTLMGDYDASIY